ncbi:uncharacterized protein V6R79_001251, partial [Siganus canaliculatus]
MLASTWSLISCAAVSFSALDTKTCSTHRTNENENIKISRMLDHKIGITSHDGTPAEKKNVMA